MPKNYFWTFFDLYLLIVQFSQNVNKQRVSRASSCISVKKGKQIFVCVFLHPILGRNSLANKKILPFFAGPNLQNDSTDLCIYICLPSMMSALGWKRREAVNF